MNELIKNKIADLEVQIQEVQRKQFFNAMDDHWTDFNYKVDAECNEKLRELSAKLEELKNEKESQENKQ